MSCDRASAIRQAMLLYAVSDRAWTGKQSLYEQIESALKGGVTAVQLREKTLSAGCFMEEAQQISSLCKRFNVPFFVNDNVDIAMNCHADGVHVGQDDMNAASLRQLVGKEMIVGVSVHTTEQARIAEQNGADYLGVGAVFATSTKSDAELVSNKVLCDICSCVHIPVVAIGGINKNNILQLAKTGIDGVALVSAIFSADDIERECRELRALSEKIVHR